MTTLVTAQPSCGAGSNDPLQFFTNDIFAIGGVTFEMHAGDFPGVHFFLRKKVETAGGW